VLPLSNSVTANMIIPRPGPAAGRRQFVYTASVTSIQANAAPAILNRSYRITAEVEVPQGGANGMLITQGGRFAGWGLYLREGKPVFTMNLLGVERPKWEGSAALLPGRHTIVFDWQMAAEGLAVGRGGDRDAFGGRPASRSAGTSAYLALLICMGRDAGCRIGYGHTGRR
jgi:hypothetical protein